jgi:ATP phosphoribosyltransferase regulatory subunit
LEFLLPKGVRIIPPALADSRERIKEVIASVFRRWGFRRVVTPTFEYYDEVYRKLDNWLNGGIVKITERETGKILVLRPDFTPQVARIASTIMKDYPRPLRLFYYGFVYRWPLNGLEKIEKETYQAGLELIGIEQPEASSEMIAIAVELLREFKIEGWRIVVGHAGFTKALLEGLPNDKKSIVFDILKRKARKDLYSLDISESKHPDILRDIFSYAGDVTVLSYLMRKVEGREDLFPIVKELRVIYGFLERYGLTKGVVFDLSEPRGMFYHNGFLFEVFAEGAGRSIAFGGRYESLMEMYGRKEPAIGFGVNIDDIMDVLSAMKSLPPSHGVDFLIVDTTESKDKGVSLASLLRSKGYSVARDIIKRDINDSIYYAKTVGIRKVLVITDELLVMGKVRLVEIDDGRDIIVDETTFVNTYGLGRKVL